MTFYFYNVSLLADLNTCIKIIFLVTMEDLLLQHSSILTDSYLIAVTQIIEVPTFVQIFYSNY